MIFFNHSLPLNGTAKGEKSESVKIKNDFPLLLGLAWLGHNLPGQDHFKKKQTKQKILVTLSRAL